MNTQKPINFRRDVSDPRKNKHLESAICVAGGSWTIWRPLTFNLRLIGQKGWVHIHRGLVLNNMPSLSIVSLHGNRHCALWKYVLRAYLYHRMSFYHCVPVYESRSSSECEERCISRDTADQLFRYSNPLYYFWIKNTGRFYFGSL